MTMDDRLTPAQRYIRVASRKLAMNDVAGFQRGIAGARGMLDYDPTDLDYSQAKLARQVVDEEPTFSAERSTRAHDSFARVPRSSPQPSPPPSAGNYPACSSAASHFADVEELLSDVSALLYEEEPCSN